MWFSPNMIKTIIKFIVTCLVTHPKEKLKAGKSRLLTF